MNPQPTETVRPRDVQSHGGAPSPAPHRASKFWLYSVPALCLALFAGLVLWKVESRLRVRAELVPAASDDGAFSVAIVHPTHSNASQTVTVPGNVQAYVETPIYARTDGYLRKWYVDIGGRVKAGELLATIDTPEVDQQLVQAEAAQLQAQANLDLAKTTADRWQNLLKADGVSQQEVDQNVAAYKARQADFNAAVANVDRLKYLQSFQRVTAPFSGVITVRSVDIGALIQSGNAKQLFQLAQIDILRVFVNVPENYANDIHLGLPAELNIAEFPGRTFTGTVAHTSGSIDPASRTLLTEVQVQNPKGELLPGAYAQVTFHIKGAVTPLVVPGNTLIFRSSGPEVAVVDADNTAHLRKVTIGRDFGNSLEVISGLREDDSVILNPSDSLQDGTLVSVTQGQTPSSSGSAQPPAGR